jgi:mannose-6-phosphate isomerase-like protein (cupin superfamily)
MQQKKIEKPWGYEILWAKTNNYAGKIIRIFHGKRLSLQYHDNKSETIYVNEGTLKLDLKVGDDLYSLNLKKGDSYHIPPKTIHRFCCSEDSLEVELFEVSTAELDDVVRIEDDFGRL